MKTSYRNEDLRSKWLPRPVGLLVLAGWFTCMPPSNAQQAPAAYDSRDELFVSADRPLRSGFWRYRVLQRPEAMCNSSHGESSGFVVVVENQSADVLDCSISLVTNGGQLHDSNTVVESRGRSLASRLCAFAKNFESATADCTIRRPPLSWNVPEGCSYTVVRQPPLHYPHSSRRYVEQAPVYVSFSLLKPEGSPQAITIATSSGFPRLDEAALLHVKRMRLRTTCPNVHYRMRVSFRLDEYGQPVETALATESTGPVQPR